MSCGLISRRTAWIAFDNFRSAPSHFAFLRHFLYARAHIPAEPEEKFTMAQKVQVILVDDIDGGSADETVSFSLDGVAYEIDLSTRNAAALRDSFAQYVGTARKVGSRSGGRGTARRRAGGGDNRTAQIREWARTHGHTVNERGRISATVVEAYEKAYA
jgi:hypothetical protein